MARGCDTLTGHPFGLVHRAVDRPFRVGCAHVAVNLLTVERESLEIVGRHQLRPERASNQVAAGVGRIADADVAECVHDALAGEDAVGGGQLVQDRCIDVKWRGHAQECSGLLIPVSPTFS